MMKSMNGSTTGYVAVAAAAALFGSGCYTQFVALNYAPPPAASATAPGTAPAQTTIVEIDSAGDTVRTRIVKRPDTVTTQAPLPASPSQNCIWTRDLTGAPVLNCYDNLYDPDYYWYNNYPWWYRYDRTYGRGYCPPGTSFDYSCNCCNSSGYQADYGGGYGGGGSPSSGSNAGSSGGRRLIDRSSGVPSAGSAHAVESTPQAAPKPAESVTPAPPQQAPESSTPSVQSNPPPQQSAPVNGTQEDGSNEDKVREKVRNAR